MARGTYAIQACDYWGLQLYSNELASVTDRRLSGTRRGSRTYVSSKTIGGGSSRSDYYRVDHFKICPSCYQTRATAIRRERRARVFSGTIVIAIVVALMVWIGNRAPETALPPNETSMGSEDQPIAEDATRPSIQTANDVNISTPSASDDDWNGSSEADSPQNMGDQVSHDAEAAPPGSPADDRQAIASAIDQVTPEALASERPVKWMAAGRSGYVVPSATQSYGDRTCRNVYATTIYGSDQRQSATVRWCRDGGSADWHLAE